MVRQLQVQAVWKNWWRKAPLDTIEHEVRRFSSETGMCQIQPHAGLDRCEGDTSSFA